MLSDLSRAIRPAVVLFLALTMITGVAYPLIVSGVAWVLFPSNARGSLIMRNGRVIGSRLIGQPFDGESYFWGRPSATTPYPYNAGASSPHTKFTEWITHETMIHSVQRHATGIQAPPRASAAQVTAGFCAYETHCVACHGATAVVPWPNLILEIANFF